VPEITPFLWFDHQAEEAANFYVSIFSSAPGGKNSKVGKVAHYGKEAAKVSGRPKGSAMTVSFQLDGQDFVALNGGPVFKFTEATSFVVNCETQEEVDHFWNRLSQGGDEKAQQCGWLKDKYGLSWQIVPTALNKLLSNPNPAKSQKVMKALLQMKKIDINGLKQASEQP
jgi:predicted 3-demethylubiquinone-9 3-methyltransferase (glyoxalase superfamily)